ncbi:hypothetical protein L6386_04145 [bacterium]|nr:hypothetical protein [bacterium]
MRRRLWQGSSFQILNNLEITKQSEETHLTFISEQSEERDNLLGSFLSKAKKQGSPM